MTADLPKMTDAKSSEYILNDGLWYDLQPVGLVFGLRGKLRPDGPFLAMLSEFWSWLLNADRLVAIGYSFGDEHINALIEDWIESRNGCVLEIVDPSTPKSRFDCGGSTPYFIRAALEYKNRESMGCPGYPGRWVRVVRTLNFIG